MIPRGLLPRLAMALLDFTIRRTRTQAPASRTGRRVESRGELWTDDTAKRGEW